MNVKLIMAYVYDVGGEKLMLQVLKENGGMPKLLFALDEVYRVIPIEKVKIYIPEFTTEKYKDWFKPMSSYWCDENGSREIFS